MSKGLDLKQERREERKYWDTQDMKANGGPQTERQETSQSGQEKWGQAVGEQT